MDARAFLLAVRPSLLHSLAAGLVMSSGRTVSFGTSALLDSRAIDVLAVDEAA